MTKLMSKLLFGLLLIGSSSLLRGQTAHSLLRTGDHNYQEQQYTKAEEAYRKANEKKPNLKGSYNLGNTLYNQNRYEEAVQQYIDATQNAKTDQEKLQ